MWRTKAEGDAVVGFAKATRECSGWKRVCGPERPGAQLLRNKKISAWTGGFMTRSDWGNGSEMGSATDSL